MVRWILVPQACGFYIGSLALLFMSGTRTETAHKPPAQISQGNMLAFGRLKNGERGVTIGHNEFAVP